MQDLTPPFPNAIAVDIGGRLGWTCKEQVEQLRAEGLEMKPWVEPEPEPEPKKPTSEYPRATLGRKGHQPGCKCLPCKNWRRGSGAAVR